MPKISKLLTAILLASTATGCATILASKSDPIAIVPPLGASFGEDLTVTENGARLPVTATSFDAVFPPGTLEVTVDSREDHTLSIAWGGKTQTCQIGTSAGVGWVILDLFVTGPLGIAIDWATHSWRSSTPAVCYVMSPGTAMLVPHAAITGSENRKPR